MCLICIDFDRGSLNLREARRALGEMRSTLDPEHLKEVEQKLDDADGALAGAPGQATTRSKP